MFIYHHPNFLFFFIAFEALLSLLYKSTVFCPPSHTLNKCLLQLNLHLNLIKAILVFHFYVYPLVSLFLLTDTRELLGEMDGIDVLLQQLSVRLFLWAFTFSLLLHYPFNFPLFQSKLSEIVLKVSNLSKHYCDILTFLTFFLSCLTDILTNLILMVSTVQN